jgi:hypothetical protein
VNFNRNPSRDHKEEYERILKNLGFEPNAKKSNGQDLYRSFPKLAAEGKVIPFGEVTPTPPRAVNNRRRGNDRAPPVQNAKLLGSDEPLNLNEFDDARKPLMEWLRSPENPYFARAFVNRVWATYFNVGIVEPPDDMSLGNPPSNKPLLDYLTQGFIENKFDMKWLHREIANSATYQRSWRTNETNAKDERNFSRSVPRRLPAEVAYDAIIRATAGDERADAMLSEMKDRGIFVATSNANANAQGRSGFALKVFGRSTRESNCDCDRSMEASLLQTVYLQNDNDVIAALNPETRGNWLFDVNALFNPRARKPDGKAGRDEGERKKELVRARIRLEAAKKLGDEEKAERLAKRLKELESGKKEEPKEEVAAADKPEPAALVRQAYLRTVSREPTGAEMERSLQFVAEAETPVEGLRDLMWALINTKEFIVNH